jgi:hypothetical protein
VVDTSLNVHIFPNNEKATSIIKARSKSIFIHIAGKTELKGYVVSAESEQLRLEDVWKIQLSPSEHIIDQTGKQLCANQIETLISPPPPGIPPGIWILTF